MTVTHARWKRRAWCAFAVVLGGCNSVLGLDQTSLAEPVTVDAAPDGPGCSGGVFGAPTVLATFAEPAFEPQLRGDLRELWFIHVNPDRQIYVATRDTADAPFGAPTRAPFSDVGANSSPALSGDGLRLVFTSTRSGTLAVYEVTRPTLDDPFGAPRALAGLGAATPDSVDLSFDGRTLYFMAPGAGVSDAYAATRPSLDAAFATPRQIGTDAAYFGISPDELELFSNPSSGYALRQHVRIAPGLPFDDSPRLLLDDGEDPDLAPDGKTLIASIGPSLAVLVRPCP